MINTIRKILEFAYHPVNAQSVGPGAQIVDGTWYMPRWGCDTLQVIFDTWDGIGEVAMYDWQLWVKASQRSGALILDNSGRGACFIRPLRAEYLKLAQQALDEPDPKRALELCEQALEIGRRLGHGEMEQ
jgi:hypothetical protein